MILKPVYLGDIPIGRGATWSDAAELAGFYRDKPVDPVELQQHAHEGPDGFYIKTSLFEARVCP